MKYLVCVDGSQSSLKAVKYAIKLASDNRSSSSIVLINAHDDEPLNRVKSFVGKKEVENFLIENSKIELKAAQKLLNTSKIKHSIIIELGHIASTIASTASTEKCDMIILGAKGRTGIVDLLLGSVAQRVGAIAKQPVLLVK